MPHLTTQPGPHKRGFWYHFNRSTYVTVITDWFLGFFGKAAHLVLILTTLYTGAELLPGVSLPGPLNNAVFVLQMLVLDVGGMGLAKLAMQARDRGNEEGAKKAEDLSKWLIRIVIASLVTVAVEQAVRAIPKLNDISTIVDGINIAVGGVLTIARAVCAVNYGRVIHSLQLEDDGEPQPTQAVDVEALVHQAISELAATLVADQQKAISQFRQEIKNSVPVIDDEAIARAIMPQLSATFQGQVRAIVEQVQSQQVRPLSEPEPRRQLQARASSQSHTEQPTLKLLPASNLGPEASSRLNGTPEERLQAAYDLLTKNQTRLSGRALAKVAHVNRDTASKWLAEVKGQQEEPEPAMIVEASAEIEAIAQGQ
ncbi:MAG TPA: hypothetical protein VFV38_39880 [Ktedonobacteraceae bacterium]|nr:hypothetical protein [Ktedonobacteraceae bacterium]